MLTWEHFNDKDGDQTWFAEMIEIERVALIKKTESTGEWAVVVGTLKDAEYMTRAPTLSDAKAKCARYMMLILNNTDKDKLKWKI